MYNDSQGVTAEFNRNVLRVVNDGLGANFAPEAFEHVAFFDEANSWIEMRLRANGAQSVRIEGADLELTFDDGKEIRTEISAKFTRGAVETELSAPGLHLDDFFTDEHGLFGLAVPRSLVVPEWARTVHCIGDLHAGAITDVRMDAVSRDTERLGTPALHLQIGDATEDGTAAQDRLALRFLERLPAPWVTALGNHDVLRNKRTSAAWARAYGQSGHNFSIDLEFGRLILIGPDRTEREGPPAGCRP